MASTALRRLTACPLYVGPGDNLKHLANPSSGILPRYDPKDCARYMERVRAADKTSKDPPEVGPHESVSQVGSEQDSVGTEITKGSSTLTDAEDPGGKKTTNHVEPDGQMLWNDCSRLVYGCPRCAAMIEAKNHAGTKGGNSPKNYVSPLDVRGFLSISFSNTSLCRVTHRYALTLASDMRVTAAASG
ncbi:hypothetical protein HD553DRAFT_44991 [Filobasidium floriforme]|uniref:uncharacterized protein n=1 Tax=Filobasidium floriforme TaxID=5210 RepID=UPI001E8E6582|nr:uncharacterized protein HD553DRAFT_44991 [Filobasidium floriforme]KAH8084274.1 hypothetical protein HD553DRAFT_44991 [Filobasidium floriforme]